VIGAASLQKQERVLRNSPEVVIGTPEQFDNLIRSEADKMRALIGNLGIQLD
jgi:superfamily II DNA/RNA helicase